MLYSRRARRQKKRDSDNDSLFFYTDNSVAKIGPVPYCNDWDMGRNGASYLNEQLYIYDNNIVKLETASSLMYRYKI